MITATDVVSIYVASDKHEVYDILTGLLVSDINNWMDPPVRIR